MKFRRQKLQKKAPLREGKGNGEDLKHDHIKASVYHFTAEKSFQNLLNSQQPNSQWNESVESVFASVPREPYQSFPREFYQSVPPESVSASDASVPNGNDDGNENAKTVTPERKERRKWSPTEDGVLISSWLNTSKDALVGNEQKASAFWKRIAAYYAASPKLAGVKPRAYNNCKSRWGKINEAVCKFVGCFEAATKQRSSGQNEDDVLKMAHEIYFNDHKQKFTMEHAWLELRYDQKWLGASTTKDKVKSKRRKVDSQTAQSSSSVQDGHGEEAMTRPVGVKAAKGKGKKPVRKQATLEEEEKERMELKNIWEIKQADFANKQTLNKQKLLDSLVTKTEPLTELESALKIKLITEFLV
ncbi:hypothetical protein YC2023_058050 [Brassica napus]